jgi:UDP-N-acetylmuramoyl-tripeptide--D-alanyl-D-alanine ligase
MLPFDISLLPTLISIIAGSYFFQGRLLRYLQYFQQEEYKAFRFLNWYWHKTAFDKRGTFAALFIYLALLVSKNGGFWLSAIICFLGLALLCYIRNIEGDPKTTGKITLKMTTRAERIYHTALIIYFIVLIVLCLTLSSYHLLADVPLIWLCQIALIQFCPFSLLLANAILSHKENNIQTKFADEAKYKFARMKPFTIGITGSYGKTSTKMILGEILNSLIPSFYPGKSINTYMGITREIREKLEPYHKQAIIEMGAYQQGSISKLCSLTPPNAGIVTAVGEMHLERFGSLESLYQAKSELAKAIPNDGILVVNGDYDLCRKMALENPKKTIVLYGLDKSKGNLDAYMHDIKPIDKGTSFIIDWQAQSYHGTTKLIGKHMLSNLLAAFSMACTLGFNPNYVLATITNIKPEKNRLEPETVPISSLINTANGKYTATKSGSILRLNDAFNSNPVGFSTALDVLADSPGKRKILVTPGMIELGEKQESENQKAAKKASSVCDFVLIVGDTNKSALVAGLKEGNMDSNKFKFFAYMKDALNFLGADYCEDKDVVLIENDLPDLYEANPKF